MKFQKGNKIGHRFTTSDQPAKNGRKPKLKSIPANAREKVYAALYHALTLPDKDEAVAYLNKVADEIPDCGFLIQVYAKGMVGKNALAYVSDILDRLFGKARQTTNLSVDAPVDVNITVGSAESAEGLRVAIENGAQPKCE